MLRITNIPLNVALNVSTRPLFETLLTSSDRFNSPSANAAIALYFTDVNIPQDAILVQKLMIERLNFSIPLDQYIISSLNYEFPLISLGIIFESSITTVFNAFANSQNWTDFKSQLDMISFCSVYADYLAILSFYSHPTSLIPKVKSNTIKSTFKKLYKLMIIPTNSLITTPANLFINESNLIIPRVTVKVPSNLEKSMAYYLISTDLIWTKILYTGFSIALKQFGLQGLPFLSVLQAIEPRIQGFFDLYTSGINKILKDEPLNYSELLILQMTWRMDELCYKNWIEMHRDTGVIDQPFINEMWTFYDNILKVQALLDNYSVK